jgi:hypothetical protein
MAATKVLGGGGGLGLLLSGLPAMIITFAIIYGIVLAVAPTFYHIVEHVLERINSSFRTCYRMLRKRPALEEDQGFLLQDEPSSSFVARERTDIISTSAKRLPSPTTAIAVSFTTLTAIVVVLILQTVRPRSPPYAHMSGSLPVTIIEAAWFQPINSEFCLSHPVQAVPFPFEKFDRYYQHTESLEWMPASQNCSRANRPGPPPWREHPGKEGSAPFGRHPPGHRRDAPSTNPLMDSSEREQRHGHSGGYDHTCDPLKLSNLDAGILDTLAESIKQSKPKIKNILLLTLESTRKDVFPFKKDSHAYKTVLDTYTSPNATAELDAKLQTLTNTAKFLSGESNGFASQEETLSEDSWRALFKDGMGALNVQGAITQAAYTLKSLVSSHCGVEPLPVDFTEETSGRIYQACLPHILEAMSSRGPDQKTKQPTETGKNDDYRSWGWASAMVQSVTDQFDSQFLLDEQMGFKNVITEATISEPTSKHFPPKQPWVNYFGYPETEALDYIRDLFLDAQQQEKRIFVSHLTSSPHHPFATPKDWEGRTSYMSKQRWRPEDPFDSYLNTIKFQDDWISQIFDMLHEIGVLNETLVILTGDHGMAFNAVDNCQTAVNNGHISNFAIPLLFVHPDLPRIQINASTTPMSIIPTVLDLLLQTDSLIGPAADLAKDLVPKYQGNSLIRELDYSIAMKSGQSEKAFFEPFHFSAINPGGSLVAISDARSPFRLIFPLCSTIPLRFTDLSVDPHETEPVIAWTMDELVAIIKVKHGGQAGEWAQLAEELGRWWFWEQREKWSYWNNARSTDRGGADIGGGRGRVRFKHWWET